MDKLIEDLKKNAWLAIDDDKQVNHKIETNEKEVIYSLIPFGSEKPTKIIKFPIAGQFVGDYFVLTGGKEKHTIKRDERGNLIYSKLNASSVDDNEWSKALKEL